LNEIDDSVAIGIGNLEPIAFEAGVVAPGEDGGHGGSGRAGDGQKHQAMGGYSYALLHACTSGKSFTNASPRIGLLSMYSTSRWRRPLRDMAWRPQARIAA
jgi:hypothetical protein